MRFLPHIAIVALTLTATAQNNPKARPRARDLGVMPGVLPAGKWNAITDVEGVLVGQVTLHQGQIVTENQDGPQAGLLSASNRIQVGPVYFTPQNVGHAGSPGPSSAIRCSSRRSSFANSRASRVRFSRSDNRSTAACRARLRFGYRPSRTQRSR